MQLIIAEKPSVTICITTVIGADERKDSYMEGTGEHKKGTAVIFGCPCFIRIALRIIRPAS